MIEMVGSDCGPFFAGDLFAEGESDSVLKPPEIGVSDDGIPGKDKLNDGSIGAV